MQTLTISSSIVSLGKAAVTALERACQQTEVLLHDLAEDGGQGAFVNLSLDVMR